MSNLKYLYLIQARQFSRNDDIDKRPPPHTHTHTPASFFLFCPAAVSLCKIILQSQYA